MPTVNGMEMPLKKQSGLLVLEDESGHQVWSLVMDATVEYDRDTEVSYRSSPQFKVIATMPPGELLRAASTVEAGEENVLVYSRLLVSVLREERDRYAELEKLRNAERVGKLNAERTLAVAVRDQDERLRSAWADGVRNGYVSASVGLSVEEALERNPQPAPRARG